MLFSKIREVFGSVGMVSRLPTIGVLIGLYYVIFKKLDRYFAAFLLYLAFISFNPVVFNQYVPYLIPFVFLYAIEKKDHYFLSDA